MEQTILNQDHIVTFIPKFHCELNPIERVWCHTKYYTRSHCDYSFQNLEKTIYTPLDSATVELIRKYFRKVREYHRAYREGNSLRRKTWKKENPQTIILAILSILHMYITNIITISYIAVAMYSRDRYKIIGLREISHFIKQPCRNVCLEKALQMHQSF